MQIEEIQKLIEKINQLDLEEVNIETETLKLKIKKHSPNTFGDPYSPHTNRLTIPPIHNQIPVTTPAPLAYNPNTTTHAEINSKQVEIKSNMIGTFYRSANPEAPPYVSVGDEVKKGQIICIIEAMKLFNEIESETSGKIIQILVEDASPVAYDQPLFLINPF